MLASRSFLIGGVPVVRRYLAATNVDVGRELWRLVISTSPSIAPERDIASFAPECVVERGGLRYFVASTACPST